MSDAWSYTESPFHAGEQRVQAKLGVREQMEGFGLRFIRDRMPRQHRDFYAEQPWLLAGGLDAAGQPWATVLSGPPGFVSTPDARTLRIAAVPGAQDALAGALAPGAPLGLLGIDLATRRRNRVNGTLTAVDGEGLELAVAQAFGNCPQYIQQRRPVARTPAAGSARRDESPTLDDAARRLVAAADTFFIATASGRATDGAPGAGVDVSHRGGKPGFVRVDADGTLTWPDFVGNNYFNTLGNLLLEPRAGLLFVDFRSGDLLQVAGRAEIVWDGPEVQSFARAERLVRLRPERVLRLPTVLPFALELEEYSPVLEDTGSWQAPAQPLWLRVARVRQESESVRSLYLESADGTPLPHYLPGQFLPLTLRPAPDAAPLHRRYTLSAAADGRRYRISVKRERAPHAGLPDGLASSWLHDAARPGDLLEARPPAGTFTPDPLSPRPLVLLSAGIGITPMVAMLQALLADPRQAAREVHFIHGARNGREHAFAEELAALAASREQLRLHVSYSRPEAADRAAGRHHGEGRIDTALLRRLLPLGDYDFYLCGPPEFMRSLYADLRSLGVAEARLHSERFGPAAAPAQAAPAPTTPVPVRFSRSGVTAAWTPAAGSLLELAEASGVEATWGCRGGSCGACAVTLEQGSVRYATPPSLETGPGETLICCATPAPATYADGLQLRL